MNAGSGAKPRDYRLRLIFCFGLLSLIILLLSGCKTSGEFGNSEGNPYIESGDNNQINPPADDESVPNPPDDSPETPNRISFKTAFVDIERTVMDVDALRLPDREKDTAVCTAIWELVSVDYDETSPKIEHIPVSVNAVELWAEDITGNGIPDILTGGSPRDDEYSVSLVSYNGGNFEQVQALVLGLMVWDVSLLYPFHLDYHDDVIDLIVYNREDAYELKYNRPSGELGPIYGGYRKPVPAGAHYSCAAKADMDGNGLEDVVMSVYGHYLYKIAYGYRYIVDPDEFNEENPIEAYDPRVLYQAMSTGKDYKVVPVSRTATNDEDVLDAIDAGTIVPSAYRLALGDFDEDELPDIALLCKSPQRSHTVEIFGQAHETDSFVLIHVNNGPPQGRKNDITVTLAQTFAVGPWAEDIGVADFDRDGHLDLIVSISGAPVIATARGRGDGTFEPFEYHSTGNYYTYRLAIGDFDDQEGKDAIMTCPLQQSILLLLNDDNTE